MAATLQSNTGGDDTISNDNNNNNNYINNDNDTSINGATIPDPVAGTEEPSLTREPTPLTRTGGKLALPIIMSLIINNNNTRDDNNNKRPKATKSEKPLEELDSQLVLTSPV